MSELPYLDERGDLHVTAAMAHEIHEAFLDAEAGRDPQAPALEPGRPHPLDVDPFYMTPAAILDRRLSAILGEERWRQEIKPRLPPTLKDPITGRERWSMIFGMRILIDPVEAR